MKSTLFLVVLLTAWSLSAQTALKPGFDKSESLEMLKIAGLSADTPWTEIKTPVPEHYRLTYRSAEVGLKNRWDQWESTRQGDAVVVSIRGTAPNTTSWLANVYAAMSPAEGVLQLDAQLRFPYKLADNPAAAVHTGWLIGMAYLAHDIMPRLHEQYANGKRDLIVTGHSQGGAIAYLFTAYLKNLQQDGGFPPDWRIKTYCGAAPKPGNLYFAYDYEQKTAGGWAFNVLNPLDWVPEVPLTVQTTSDFNTVSPLTNAEAAIRKQEFPKNLALKHVYKKLRNPAHKANKNYQKYFGKKANQFVKKTLPGFEEPQYFNSNHYCRTGQFIVLKPDADYLKKYPNDPKTENVFIHHLPEQYIVLMNKY
jgi:hypothetical protein